MSRVMAMAKMPSLNASSRAVPAFSTRDKIPRPYVIPSVARDLGRGWRAARPHRSLATLGMTAEPHMTVTEHQSRVVRAPRGTEISCRGWQQEAALRMLMNNLDPEVAERPEQLIVYGGIGKAARNWECFDAIVATLERLKDNETLLVQSGKPVGVFRTHEDA